MNHNTRVALKVNAAHKNIDPGEAHRFHTRYVLARIDCIRWDGYISVRIDRHDLRIHGLSCVTSELLLDSTESCDSEDGLTGRTCLVRVRVEMPKHNSGPQHEYLAYSAMHPLWLVSKEMLNEHGEVVGAP